MDTIVNTHQAQEKDVDSAEIISKEKINIHERYKASADALTQIRTAILDVVPAGISISDLEEEKKSEANAAIAKLVKDTPVVVDTRTQEKLSLTDIRDRIEKKRFTAEQLKQVLFLQDMMNMSPLLRWTILNKLRDKAISLTIGKDFRSLEETDKRTEVRTELVHITEVLNKIKESNRPVPLALMGGLTHDVFKWVGGKMYLAEHEVQSAWYSGEVVEEVFREISELLTTEKSSFLMGFRQEKQVIEYATAQLKDEDPQIFEGKNEEEVKKIVNDRIDAIISQMTQVDPSLIGEVMQKLNITHGFKEFPKNMSSTWKVGDDNDRIQVLSLSENKVKAPYVVTAEPEEMEWIYEADISPEAQKIRQEFRDNANALAAGDMSTGLSRRSLEKYSRGYSAIDFSKGFLPYIDKMFESFKANYKDAPETFGIKNSESNELERRSAALFRILAEEAARSETDQTPDKFKNIYILKSSKNNDRVEKFIQEKFGINFLVSYQPELIHDIRNLLTLKGQEYLDYYESLDGQYNGSLSGALKDLQTLMYSQDHPLEAPDLLTKVDQDLGSVLYIKVCELKKIAISIQQKLPNDNEATLKELKNQFDTTLSDIFSKMQHGISLTDLRSQNPLTQEIEELLEKRYGGLKTEKAPA